MKKSKAKLLALLVAASCSAACVGVGVSMLNPTSTSITAKAESVYTLNNVKVLSSSNASLIYAYVDVADDQKPTVSSWDYRFYFEEGTGAGFLFNGEAISGYSIKQPGRDFYIELGKAAVEGDTVKIDGTFSSADSDVKFVFNNCNFKFNGSTWVVYTPVEYTTYKLGALALHPNSTIGGAAGSNDVVYFKRADGGELPIKDWSSRFVLDRAENFKINGEPANLNQISSTGDGLYLKFDRALNAGDYITISGSFSWDAQTAQFVVEESSFQWTGSSWIVYVDYPDTVITSFTPVAAGSTATVVYLLAAEDLPVADWEEPFEYVSGNGITLNGTMLKTKDVKSYDGKRMYLGLGKEAQAGDTLKIGGVFRSKKYEADYVIADQEFVWDGSAWTAKADVEPEEPSINYETYTVTKIGGYNNGTAIHLYSLSEEKFPEDKSDWDSVYSFEAGSGEGIKVNDTVLSNNGIKMPGDLYVPYGEAAVDGDIFTIDGTYYNEEKAVKLIFDNCKMQFNGETEKWVEYVEEVPPTEYATYEIGQVTLGKDTSAYAIYLNRADGNKYPVTEGTWKEKLTFLADSGAGVTLNGEQVAMDDIKIPNFLYIGIKKLANGEATALNEGDVLVVEGTFYNETLAVKYVITKSEFIWDGSAWGKKIDYTTHEVGALSFKQVGGNNMHAYFLKLNGESFPICTKENNLHWETKFSWKNGVGVTINDKDVNAVVKYPGEMFLELKVPPVVGDILKIGGTFYSETLATQYIVEESVFEWIGDSWIPVVEYTDYEVGALKVAGLQTSASDIVLTRVDNGSFAADDTFKFRAESGVGIALNGVVLDVKTIRTSGGQLNIALGTNAKDGDTLTIGGKFYNVDTQAQYVITESMFIYTNGSWQAYVSEYEEIGIGAVKVNADASSEKFVYLAPVVATELPVNSWEDEDVFTCKYGAGVRMNGQPASMTMRSIDNEICITLATEAQVGDILDIGGKFVCDAQGILYYIEESKFMWNGEAWESYIEYTTVNVGKLSLYGNSATADLGNAGLLHLNSSEYTFEAAEFALTYESGSGFTVNGEQKAWKVFKNHAEGYLYLSFEGVQIGDDVTIGGTFVCPDRAIKYVIEESTFTWEGAWTVECEKIEVGAVTYHASQPGDDKAFYVIPLNQMVLPVSDWIPPFVHASGNGITLNGEPIDYTNSVKSLGTSIYIQFSRAPQEGDVVVIDGSLRCAAHAVEYVFAESILVYTNNAWVNQLYGEQAEKKAALDEYLATFTADDYYESEWTAMQEIVVEAKAAINDAIVKAEVLAAFDGAKAAMDAVATKAEVDANFGQWKIDAKAELEAYTNVSEYREAEQAEIAAIVAQAKTDIDACESSTALNKIVKDAKAALDALFTDAEWVEAEAVAAAAKAELASYKTESNYKAAQWAEIQSIIAKAEADINAAIRDSEAVAKIVKDTKAKLDAVKTAVQVNAEEAVVAAAKAELASYKAEGNYNQPEWNEIKAIIEKANADIDAAIGDSEAIAKIVETAKGKMDKVLNKDEADAKAFADAKAKEEADIRAYVNAIDYSLYTDENAAIVNGYIADAMEKLENATTYADFENLAEELQAKVDGVEKLAKNEEVKVGCFGSVTGLTTSVMLAAAAAIVLRKKKDD